MPCRYWSLAAVVLLAGPLAAQKQAKLATLRWYGQSFFVLTTSSGTRVAFDPHGIEAFGRFDVSADVCTVSHPHTDHTQVGIFQNADKVKVFNGIKAVGRRQEWNAIDEKFKDVRIYSVPCYHDADEGMTRGKNTIFVVEADGLRFCHLGDLGHELTEPQLKAIGSVDVLMIPVGGVYTINGDDAFKIVKQIKPRLYFLPMHYGIDDFDDLPGPDEFFDKIPKPRVQPELVIPTNLKLDQAKPILLSYKHAEKK